MSGSPRRHLLERIDRELALAAAIPERLETLSDRELHAMAARERACFAMAAAGQDERALETSARAMIRTWAALGQRRSYVEALAVPIVGVAAPKAHEVATRIGVERVASVLLARARLGQETGALLRALAQAGALGADVSAIARRARLEALDAVADPLRRTLDELATRRPTLDEVVAAFAAVHTAWRHADRDVELEVLAVERLADFAWDLYRDRRLAELGRVVAEVAEPSASLAARIERGDAIAWAAPCAQVLVFRAELATRFDAQLALAERAYAVCPSLRNARLVLGDFLLTRAERALDRGTERTSGDTLPADDVARAASLHPDLKRLAPVREKLARRGRPAA